ncbi:hypothetical protein J2T17_007126 [Paenibacillus mucilaginosus]|uniref:hypothetical protein n=1 Tax=Paenibacillus mucilaginosus TaxID=61624 RepID=UPI003D1BE555
MKLVKDRQLQEGEIVQVYQNLNRDCFSIRSKKSGLVLAYAETVTLRNASYKVSERSRQRVLSSRVRNVHAFVEGEFVTADSPTPAGVGQIAYYNPYTTDHFYNEQTRQPVRYTEIAHCQEKRVHFG